MTLGTLDKADFSTITETSAGLYRLDPETVLQLGYYVIKHSSGIW